MSRYTVIWAPVTLAAGLECSLRASSVAGLWATASGPLFLGFETPEPDKMQPGRRSLQTLDAAWMYAT